MEIINDNKISNKKENNIQMSLGKLDGVKSKYQLNNILSYIKDDNFILKLFAYSKKYQKLLNLSINIYKEKYFDKIGLNLIKIKDFCSCYDDYKYCLIEKSGYPGYYRKDYLPKKCEKYKNKFNANIIEDYILYYIEKNKIKYQKLYLDIYSPYFNILSKMNNFSDIFIIIISMKFIKEYNLENDYIKIFNTFNKLNLKFSILFRFINSNDINYFEKFKINIKNIKRLILLEDTDIGKYEHFFENFFSFTNDLSNNLIYLKISLKNTIYKETILLQNINNFKSLEQLELNDIYFKSIFILDLPKLKTLNISKCNNISISSKLSLNLINLYFEEFTPKQENVLKFPKLEKCEFYQYFSIFDKIYKNYNSIFDFVGMKNLKVLKAEADDFLKLGNNILLEDLSVISNTNNIEIEKKIIEKIITMKSLKKINLSLNKIDYKDISNIQGINNSITSINIKWKNHSNYELYNLQEKFPNVSDLNLDLFSEGDDNTITDIEITENKKYKINNLIISCGLAAIKLYCQSYKNLEEIYFNIRTNFKNFEDKFPFFKNNCDIIFSSLKSFSFYYYNEIDIEILNNLCNNLDKMKKLKKLCLQFTCKKIDINYYNRLNDKLSLLNLDFIYIKISNGVVIIGELLNSGEYEETKNINEFKKNGIVINKLD